MNVWRVVALAAVASGLLLTSRNACAQTSQSVTSTATVTTPITGGAIASLAFGAITKGESATVPSTSSSAGAFYFSGDESDNITLTVPASVVLNTTSGSGGVLSVAIDRAAMRANSADNVQSHASAANASSGSVTVPLSSDGAGNGTGSDGLGQVYLWVGGSITPAAVQQRGSYSGTFTVNASYSN